MSRHNSLGLVTVILTGVLLAGAAGCGAPPAPTSPAPAQPTPPFPATAPFEFIAAPIELFGQTYATWPGYAWVGSPSASMAFAQVWGSDVVLAPGAGVVHAVRPDGPDWRNDVIGAQSMQFYLSNLATVSVSVGDRVAGGDRVGTRNREPRFGRLGHVRLGVISLTARNFFVSPGRHSDDVLFGEYPLKYFVEPLRSQILGFRSYSTPDARLDYDVAGTLMGLWFEESVSMNDSLAAAKSDQRLWFVYTNDLRNGGYGPRTLRISTPSIAVTSMGTPLPGSPHPQTITPASGLTVIHMEPEPIMPSWPVRLLVEMQSATRVRAEAYWGPAATAPTQFTDKARTYIR
jgi:hypothetical protein